MFSNVLNEFALMCMCVTRELKILTETHLNRPVHLVDVTVFVAMSLLNYLLSLEIHLSFYLDSSKNKGVGYKIRLIFKTF